MDEMAFDPRDQVFIEVNNAEDPPFATIISTKQDHKIIGKVMFAEATVGVSSLPISRAMACSICQSPKVNKDPKKGAVAVIDPATGKLVKMLPVESCHPAGLAFGPNDNFILGCNANGKEMPAVIAIMNARTGTVVATVPGLGGADRVNYNAKNNQYYTASRDNPGAPALGVINAGTNKLVQMIAITGGAPHSVTSSEANGHVYVPVGMVGGGDGTGRVFAPKS